MAIAVVACAGVAAGCGGAGRQDTHPFWLRGPGTLRAHLAFDAGEAHAALQVPGVASRADVAGRVLQHRPSDLPGMTMRVDLERDDGSRAALHYSAGLGNRLPLEIGDLTRVRVLRRRHVDDDGEDSAMLIWLRPRPSAPPAATPGGPGAVGLGGAATPAGDERNHRHGARSERLYIVGQSRGLLGRDALPRLLHGLQPTDVAVYHRTDLTASDCEETHAHSWFRLQGAENARRVLGRRHDLDNRRVAPGSEVVMGDAEATWTILLLENRRTVSSTCRVPTEPAWSWLAIAAASGPAAPAALATPAAVQPAPAEAPTSAPPR